jgi:hypothetical protein
VVFVGSSDRLEKHPDRSTIRNHDVHGDQRSEDRAFGQLVCGSNRLLDPVRRTRPWWPRRTRTDRCTTVGRLITRTWRWQALTEPAPPKQRSSLLKTARPFRICPHQCGRGVAVFGGNNEAKNEGKVKMGPFAVPCARREMPRRMPLWTKKSWRNS